MRRKKPKPNFWRSKEFTAPPEEMERAMSGKRNRAKGLEFERKVANLFKEIYPGARRWLENHKDDAKGIDIVGTDPFKIQCKKLHQYVSVNTIREIQCSPELGDVPVLITAGDNQAPMAVLALSDFLWMVKRVERT